MEWSSTVVIQIAGYGRCVCSRDVPKISRFCCAVAIAIAIGDGPRLASIDQAWVAAIALALNTAVCAAVWIIAVVSLTRRAEARSAPGGLVWIELGTKIPVLFLAIAARITSFGRDANVSVCYRAVCAVTTMRHFKISGLDTEPILLSASDQQVVGATPDTIVQLNTNAPFFKVQRQAATAVILAIVGHTFARQGRTFVTAVVFNGAAHAILLPVVRLTSTTEGIGTFTWHAALTMLLCAGAAV